MKRWILLALLAAACRPAPPPDVVVYTTLDRAEAAPVLQKIAEKSDKRIGIVYGGDELYQRLLAESGKPRADVLWAADSVRPLALAQRNLLEDLKPGRRARARVLVVNARSGATPLSLIDLVNPKWKGKIAIPDPARGDGALLIAALAAGWGDERAQKFLEALAQNGARVASDDAEVVKLVASGEAAFGVAGDGPVPDGVTKVFPDVEGSGTLVVRSAVAVLAGAPHPARAAAVAEQLAGEPEAVPAKAMAVRDDEIARALDRVAPMVRAMKSKPL